MAVSIIIPLYNEGNLEPLLANLNALNGKFEVIFVSGDNTHYNTQNFTHLSYEKGRAKQLNFGAKRAKFENLWFLHADSKFSKNAILEIENFLTKNSLGAFRLKFDSDKFLLKVCAFFSNLRVKFGGIAFGDQGMFLSKELFFKLGGFKDIKIMEDYEFSLNAKKNGLKFNLCNEYITTSSRRFLKYGTLKMMIKMPISRLLYRFGVSEDKILRFYYAKS
ncbi:TIGR04283 family arsenosugar biosynthesis glycosyltransferase [Campylobacter corcagiensis]|uniref:TIGR04283 family arsenosugar biosynthesis glycosyltransferase n=1 Tax=Campylobacter corcagiensis TaxID=1448857 RepID=A0A7M1LHW1_9BACT|nr:TIGR04283 family arsenosugar biosynthesis glycosyltransferase [Campylobacter corcagiensis]QKF64751.1 glycosyltransferase, family 2 [Campylobacter corcagiensis]QOQ87085.1 TIGR04283 family arsenosugar biosynthesis glycosyltransferase [Campylobacter corcagiensis]